MNSDNQSKVFEAEKAEDRIPLDVRAGRAYPPVFLESLGEGLLSRVAKYLEKSGAPTDIIYALDAGWVLMQRAGYAKAGPLEAITAADLAYTLPEDLALYLRLGGALYDYNGSEIPNPIRADGSSKAGHPVE